MFLFIFLYFVVLYCCILYLLTVQWECTKISPTGQLDAPDMPWSDCGKQVKEIGRCTKSSNSERAGIRVKKLESALKLGNQNFCTRAKTQSFKTPLVGVFSSSTPGIPSNMFFKFLYASGGLREISKIGDIQKIDISAQYISYII